MEKRQRRRKLKKYKEDLKDRRERHPERYLAHTFLTFKETISEADRGKWIEASKESNSPLRKTIPRIQLTEVKPKDLNF